MNDNANGFAGPVAKRVTLWGPIIAAVIGLIGAVNAMRSDEYIGAGVCIIGAALSFAVIGLANLRK